jgi:serine/threonine protein kinase
MPCLGPFEGLETRDHRPLPGRASTRAGAEWGTSTTPLDAGVSRYVAIKLLRADLYDVPAVAETFVSEAQRIAKLEAHENIPTVYEVGVHEHRPFIAMQKIEGLTLAELLRKRGVVSVDTLRVVASGVGGALAFAHDRGIVHCDVKPQNVLLDRAQKPYLTDFGISRARPDPLGAEAPDLCGHTPYYASPRATRWACP